MTALKQVYRCNVCGNIVTVLHSGAGELVCCGQAMELLKEKEKDVGQEKHVPVVEEKGDGVRVSVGSLPHPMEDDHYIEWIEVSKDGITLRRLFKPGDKPEADFTIKPGNLEVRIYCNVHGLWRLPD